MIPVSVVLIARNEAHIIGDTIRSVQALTDDIIVVDSGSTDGTQDLAASLGATIIQTTWEGFGSNKNKGVIVAKYDWILSIDADEQPDEMLLDAIKKVDLTNPLYAYNVQFKTFFGNKLIRFGEWGKDSHIRFFNRTIIKWNKAEVHEQLVIPPTVSIRELKGFINHYTMKDLSEFAIKMTRYALLYAERSSRQGKRAGWVKRNFSPLFSFIQNYIIKLGFLDGWEGFIIAKMTSYYTFLKYARLHEINKLLKRR